MSEVVLMQEQNQPVQGCEALLQDVEGGLQLGLGATALCGSQDEGTAMTRAP